ncbi:Potassium-transporting ATPase, subunit A [Candidatus Protochlamydia naegleriophila]|uniref:Potassium-transporting ATPase potassium-binding subunit n=1 Tax=Candidatus Protochlamydia naegleriophila TaxID=389348 RepID=A0A0U5EUQ3_9BACT|nr:potassium-transporting ATPase subunit KdpA [Candidatus Protochlamydia naegleriophila]CUI17984.1 Potassium-transporting ATPase, subunit A [Candidatus Protochlamydia naegleriophila]
MEIGVFILLLLIVVPLLGRYMAEIFEDHPKRSIPLLSYLENLTYRICQIDPNQEMTWKSYAKSMLYFNAIGFGFLFLLQLLQGWLPLNPQSFSGVEPALAFNTAASFTTNTNWQAYGGENTLSYLTQMLGLTVQNFVSAATGSAVLLALIRGIRRKSSQTIGNFWVDLTRTVVYLFLPFCLIFALILISQGVIQNLHGYVVASTLAGDNQTIPMGPVASQIAIKQFGTNGGGFFNANSAHPFENPTPLSNFLETFAILVIPAAATYMYGLMIKSRRQGWVIFSVMFILWLGGLTIALASEYTANPVLAVNPVLEGKETRFGTSNSILWAISTTGTSNGSVNSMHSSLSPLAGGMAMFNIMIGEVVFGGVGVGLCGMLMFVLLTVFLAGLMVGRTPEYLGKKIEKSEMQWIMLAILAPCALILLGAGIASVLPNALESLSNAGPHGLSEILYAFSSAAGNNGSAFAGLNANTYFYNIVLGFVMILARLAILVPSLAVAGSLAQKHTIAPSLGTFATDRLLFGVLLLSVIFIVAALTFFPALSLGPIIEQILMLRGQAF